MYLFELCQRKKNHPLYIYVYIYIIHYIYIYVYISNTKKKEQCSSMNFMILCSGISGILATPIWELKLHRSLEEREESKSASEDELKALEEARGQGPELSCIHTRWCLELSWTYGLYKRT